mmetsp:Transcript_3985/g.6142  ORF Transcript_3985/g.6142 Transcript_3985/m.6142 type:complete len:299 (+) Transcript_3985:1820-2716(+)
MCTRLEPVHQCQQLRHNTPLHLSLGLLSLGCNRIDLINEDDGGGVLFSLFKGLAEVTLRLSSQLGHDLRAVNQEEEGARLICNCTGNEGLAGPRWTIQQNTLGRLYTDALEQLGVTQREFDQLTDLCKLFADTANVIIAHIVITLLIFSLDCLPFAVDDGIRGHNTVFDWICLYYFEFYSPHATTHKEKITLPDRTICFQEVGLQVDVEQVACEAFYRVVDRENMDTLAILDVLTLMHRNNVSQTHSQIVAYYFVHSYLRLFASFISQDDANCVLSFFALDQHSISSEKLKFLHFLKI